MAKKKDSSQVDALQKELEAANLAVEAAEKQLKKQKENKKKIVRKIEEAHLSDMKKLAKETGASADKIKDEVLESAKKGTKKKNKKKSAKKSGK